ncbi:hypothetical protein [Pelagibacterium halotolerans]
MELYAQAIAHATARVLFDRDHQVNNDLGAIAQNIEHGFRPR